MDILKRHEMFEMEALEKLQSEKLLDALVFGGGTMLRLCYELNRYSADLDFWFLKKIREKGYFDKMRSFLGEQYELTDAQMKSHTLLFEFRSSGYPKRLKIEIRRTIKNCDYQDGIAFSRFGTKQVALKVHTLEQTMRNKISALTDRREIRDCFDIEFLMRRGIPLPQLGHNDLNTLLSIIDNFKEKDFTVKLGSIIEGPDRKYYSRNRFSFLRTKVVSLMH